MSSKRQSIVDMTENTKRNSNIDEIIQDASKKKRNEALFFNYVIGGSTTIVEEVLDKLQEAVGGKTKITKNNKNAEDKSFFSQEEAANLRNWMLGRTDQDYAGCTTNCSKQLCEKITKILCLPILWLVITPVFYIFHGFICSILNSEIVNSNRSISKYENLDFPFAFAVLSRKKDMIELFLGIAGSNNSKDPAEDSKENNCYSPRIDLKDSKGHNIMHYIAEKSKSNLPLAEHCYETLKEISKQHNLDLTALLDSANIYNQTPVEYACQFGNLQFASQLINEQMIPETATKWFDGSETENDEKGNDTTKKDENKQGWRKSRMDVTKYSLRKTNTFMSQLLCLIFARAPSTHKADDWESIQKNSCLQKWMDLKLMQWIVPGVFLVFLEIFISLLLVFGLMQTTQGDMLLTPNREIFGSTHTNDFLLKWNNSNPNTTFHSLGVKFFHTNANLLNVGWVDYPRVLRLIRQVDSSFSDADMSNLYDSLCVTGSVYIQVGDLVKMDNCTITAAIAVASKCDSPNNYELAIATSFAAPIYNDKRSIYKNTLRLPMTREAPNAMLLTLIAYFSLYLFLDIICRLATLIQQLYCNASMYSIFATPIHGSYTKGQCNIFSGFAFIVIISKYYGDVAKYFGSESVSLKDDILSFDRNDIDTIEKEIVLGAFLVFMFVSRIILHLNTMKLFPWVGTFVITTFQMAADLFKFTLIYVVILFFFSVLFHTVSRDTTCPAYRNEKNKFLYNSLFTTFIITFGATELSFDNSLIKMTYAVYAVMSIILLLNLIIAVMNSTASVVTIEPYLSQLYKESRLAEVLGIEDWLTTVFPCNGHVKWSLSRAGFIVDPFESEGVFVEVFEGI